ncbi:MAG: hypothetical protein LBF87_02135 [Treponema sp.]|nr:hypothetical protein [Treponema sp.]
MRRQSMWFKQQTKGRLGFAWCIANQVYRTVTQLGFGKRRPVKGQGCMQARQQGLAYILLGNIIKVFNWF